MNNEKIFKNLAWFLWVMGSIGLALYGASAWAWEPVPTRGQIKGIHVTELQTAVTALQASVSAIVASGTSGSGDAETLQGRTVDTATPSDGQVLTWADSGSKWTPTTPSTSGAAGIPDFLKKSAWQYTPSYYSIGEITGIGIASDGNVVTQSLGNPDNSMLDGAFGGATGTELLTGNGPIDFVTIRGRDVLYYNGTWNLATTTISPIVCAGAGVYTNGAAEFRKMYYVFASASNLLGTSKGLYSSDLVTWNESIDILDTSFVDLADGWESDMLGLTASGSIWQFSWDYVATYTPTLAAGTPRKIAVSILGSTYNCLSIFDSGGISKIYRTSIGDVFSTTQVATADCQLHDLAYVGNGIFLATRFPDSVDDWGPVFLYSTDYGATWNESDLLFSNGNPSEPSNYFDPSGSTKLSIGTGLNGEVILSGSQGTTYTTNPNNFGKPRALSPATQKNPVFMMTPEGGHAVLMKATGTASITKGEAVTVSAFGADYFVITPTSSQAPIGVMYSQADGNTTCAVGSYAWIVMSGRADVKADAGGFSPGSVLITSDATAGRGKKASTIPPTTQNEHNGELGHAIATASANGLGMAVLHFN